MLEVKKYNDGEPKPWSSIEKLIEKNLDLIHNNIVLSSEAYIRMKNLDNRREYREIRSNIIIPQTNIKGPYERIPRHYMNDLIDLSMEQYNKNILLKLEGKLPKNSLLIPPLREFDERIAEKYIANFDSSYKPDRIIFNLPYFDNNFYNDSNLNLI